MLFISFFLPIPKKFPNERAEMDNHLLVFRCVEQLDHDWLLFAYISSNFDKRISVTRFEMVIKGTMLSILKRWFENILKIHRSKQSMMFVVSLYSMSNEYTWNTIEYFEYFFVFTVVFKYLAHLNFDIYWPIEMTCWNAAVEHFSFIWPIKRTIK